MHIGLFEWISYIIYVALFGGINAEERATKKEFVNAPFTSIYCYSIIQRHCLSVKSY